MERPTYNKSALKRERTQLAMYRRYLPSLDLKRQQLNLELKKARGVLIARRRDNDELLATSRDWIGLYGGSVADYAGLVRIADIEIGEENLMGVRLPRLGEVRFEVEEYSRLAAPHWVDRLIEEIEIAARLRLQIQVDEERVERLTEAARRITQRVNLFEKVLIPRAVEHIRRIQIYLSDTERAAVVRSKLSKTRQQARSLHA